MEKTSSPEPKIFDVILPSVTPPNVSLPPVSRPSVDLLIVTAPILTFILGTQVARGCDAINKRDECFTGDGLGLVTVS